MKSLSYFNTQDLGLKKRILFCTLSRKRIQDHLPKDKHMSFPSRKRGLRGVLFINILFLPSVSRYLDTATFPLQGKELFKYRKFAYNTLK